MNENTLNHTYISKFSITWVDDYCFDCLVLCKNTDEEHREHTRLSSVIPEELLSKYKVEKVEYE